MKDATRIAIVLDRSGSMASQVDSTISGFNEFINQLRSQPGEASVKLVQFDDEYEVVFDRPLAEVPLLNEDTFLPRGMTALLDAQGRTIDDLGAELKTLPEAERPMRVVVMTVTDGQENASKKYIGKGSGKRNAIAAYIDKSAVVRKMIEHQQNVYKWEFLYLGANQDAIAIAASMGIQSNKAMNFTGSRRGVGSTYSAMGQHVNAVRGMATMDFVANVQAFSDEDRAKAMAEDDDPMITNQQP